MTQTPGNQTPGNPTPGNPPPAPPTPAASSPPGTVSLTINGRRTVAPKGTLLVEAALQVGVEIPVFCYHKKLKPVGACRMCLVEIGKMPRLQTACTTPVAEGMVVDSASPAAVEGQNAVLELLLANHPLDCPICDKGGECPLQDNAFRYGLGTSRMAEDKRSKDKAYPLSDRIALDKERCILCYRCTRFQDEIVGDQALVALDRGGDSEIGTETGGEFESPFSGNTIELCPVGALTSRFYRFRARPWDLVHTPSVCSGCSVGCNVTLDARDGAILRVLARDNPRIDDGWLCDRGRFQTLPPVTAPGQVTAPDPAPRPLWPLLRQHGALQRVPLEQALAAARQLLGDRAAVLAAPTLTNEAIVQLDSVLRPRWPGAQFGFLPRAHSPWLVEGRIDRLPQCRKVLLLGLDPWTELPVLALWLRKAAQAGAAIVAVGPGNGLYRDTAAWLQAPAEQVVDHARALLRALQGGGADEDNDDDVVAAAARLRRDGPAAVLLHPVLARDPELLAIGRQLAARLGADGTTGMLGAPAFGANARGVQELAPQLADAAVDATDLQALLLLGAEPLPPPCGARLVVAGSAPLPARDDVDVVLPMLHAYETAGTWINFTGERQRLQAGGFVGRGVLADHQLLAALAGSVASGSVAPAGAGVG